MKLGKNVFFVLSFLMALSIVFKSIDYLQPIFEKGFLLGKESFFWHYKIPLYVHIFSAPLALLIGLFQTAFLKNAWHQKLGKMYVFLILFCAAPSGFYMAFYAIGGTISVINFLLLSSFWWFYTYKGYVSLQKNYIKQNIHFMIGSFILTNSAIFLRFFLVINHQFQFIEGVNGYIIVSILSWLPFIMVYEIIQKRKKNSI